MADTNTELRHPSKPPTPWAKAQKTSASFLCSSLHKAIAFVLVVALLPLFPSEAPQFMNKSISTRSWELIYLLVVGIAISYGLFSRRNTEPDMGREAEHLNKADDGPQSYFSQILHGGSNVFNDDEVESPCDDRKIRISSSQYHLNEPLVVFESETGFAADGRDASRPLCLPVRSLKSHAEGSKMVDEAQINSARMEMKIPPTSSSSSAPSKVPSFRDGTHSPIRQSSSSSRTSFAEESTPSKAPSFRDGTHSPIRHSPSPDRKEMRGKSCEDRVNKKSFYPPPALPPPLFTSHGYHYNLDRKLGTPRFKDELKDSVRRENQASQPDCETKASKNSDTTYVERSVRTIRSNQKFHCAKPESPQKEPLPMNSFMDKAVIVSDDDSDSEGDDDVVADSINKEVPSSATAADQGDENEVDKKADEFIAKFREQIRLQRIASIKRTAKQRSTSRSNKPAVI